MCAPAAAAAAAAWSHGHNLIEESVPVFWVVVIVGVGVAQVFAFELKGDVFRRRGFELHQQRP